MSPALACGRPPSRWQAWQEFDEDGRMKDSNFRDRVVDVMEEYYKLLGLDMFSGCKLFEAILAQDVSFQSSESIA